MIGFRLDANEHIATGHMMRCIAIATECRKLGQECLFLLAEEKETERLTAHQFAYRILNTRWNHMEEEIPVLAEIIQQEKMDYLVVDSYQATPDYLKKINKLIPVLYLDDMALATYEIDAVLHYGFCSDRDAYIKRYACTTTKVMIGLEYIPLREEFQPDEEKRTYKSIKGECSEFSERFHRIMITTGGTDPFDVTGEVLRKCITDSVFQDYFFDVIMGSMNQNVSSLMQLAEKNKKICLYKNVQNMGDFMRNAEIAVSAGGTTLFELCACGTPTICFSFADNQQGVTIDMESRHVMFSAGDARDTDVVNGIVEQLKFWINNPKSRQEYTQRMQNVVDGKGAIRVAEFLAGRV